MLIIAFLLTHAHMGYVIMVIAGEVDIIVKLKKYEEIFSKKCIGSVCSGTVTKQL